MLHDKYTRDLNDLRISVTDRCNFRCTYCMPLESYRWIERREVLCYEEIFRLARLFIDVGVNRIRLTGGEPLLRKDLEQLIEKLSALDGLKDLCLTTNGALLTEKASDLKSAGLGRINVSLDTLDTNKFKKITQKGNLERVLEGLDAAKHCRFSIIKINTVVERGVNDDEILDLVEFSRENCFPIRFIEFMDVGNSNNWKSNKVVTKEEILGIIHARYPLREVESSNPSAPSTDYEFKDGGGQVGIIASVTEPFCSTCTRARLTADGKLVTCLFSENGFNLKKLLRSGVEDHEIRGSIERVWEERKDRYSEDRLEALQSIDGYQAENHRKMEMIQLGG